MDNIIEFLYDPKKDKILLKTKLLNEIREAFSENNDKYSLQIKLGKFAPKRFYAITKSGRFDCGLFTLVYKFCKKEYPEFKIKIDEQVNTICFPKLDSVPIGETKYKIRDYQSEAIQSAFKFGRGIIKIGTGGGKTLIISTILESLYHINNEFMAIIVVPNLGLVNQTCADFKEYGVSFTYSKWTGSTDFTKN